MTQYEVIEREWTITKDNLPKGRWWQEDGACFQAELCDIDPADNGWRWVPKNSTAIGHGKPNAKMLPFMWPVKSSNNPSPTEDK